MYRCWKLAWLMVPAWCCMSSCSRHCFGRYGQARRVQSFQQKSCPLTDGSECHSLYAARFAAKLGRGSPCSCHGKPRMGLFWRSRLDRQVKRRSRVLHWYDSATVHCDGTYGISLCLSTLAVHASARFTSSPHGSHVLHAPEVFQNDQHGTPQQKNGA